MNGGREGRPIGAYELAQAVEALGAGEILLNCIDCDGKRCFNFFLSNTVVTKLAFVLCDGKEGLGFARGFATTSLVKPSARDHT